MSHMTPEPVPGGSQDPDATEPHEDLEDDDDGQHR